ALRAMGYDTKTDVCGHGFRTIGTGNVLRSLALALLIIGNLLSPPAPSHNRREWYNRAAEFRCRGDDCTFPAVTCPPVRA
ncbi:hypothetical protein NQ253_27250, partial [Escherichia coli]|nr:hypothetical protein [Escherichia coli]